MGNNLLSAFPDVVKQWDYEKNGELMPENIKPRSAKKVWWLCDKWHSWQAAVYNRTASSPQGCPYCSGRRVLPGFNDLASKRPDVSQQWDYEKNGELTPEQITTGSGKKVWWLCEKGHSWQAPVLRRTQSKGGVGTGSSCPYCLGRKVLSGFNDLETTHPNISRMWDYEKNGDTTPRDVRHGSNKKFWWICEDGHHFQSSPYSLTGSKFKGSGCPYCHGRRVHEGSNDLASTHPELIPSWDFDKNDVHPQNTSRGQHLQVWWRCEEGHSYKSPIYSRVAGNGCPTCNSRSITSRSEAEISEYVSSILPDNTEIVLGDRSIISPKELDIYIPSRKIAIEFNGLYWHSEESGKDRHYHQDKWLSCNEKGIQLITVWEDQWRDSPEVVKSMIRHKLGMSSDERVYARNTTVKEVPLDQVRNFCEAHHIQGFTQGSAYLGLYDRGNTLVAVSVWRKNGSRLYLDRYCTSATVVGGMGKLLKAGKRWAREKGCTHIITFSDHEVSDGGLYQKLGFTLNAEIKPDYRYVVDGKRVHKFNYRLKKFRNDPELEYREGLSERELARLNGIPRIWDCGKTRWVMEVS